MLLRNGVFPEISINKDVTVISNCNPPMWAGESYGELKKRRIQLSSIHCTAFTSYSHSYGEPCWKLRIVAPDGWDAYQRNDFSEPRLLHLPTHTIALNSLTSDTRFSLINSNLLKSWLPGLCCKNSPISWLLPHLFAAVSQSFLRSYLIPGFSLQFCKPNKT